MQPEFVKGKNNLEGEISFGDCLTVCQRQTDLGSVRPSGGEGSPAKILHSEAETFWPPDSLNSQPPRATWGWLQHILKLSGISIQF